MTLLARDIRNYLVARILTMMREAAAQEEDPTLGPPCSRFYVRQHQDVSLPSPDILGVPTNPSDVALEEYGRAFDAEMAQRKVRFDLARIVSIWEVSSGEARELDADEHPEVRCGALRVELYENAIVDFWTEAAAGLVHVDWVFGPSYGLGQTSRIRHRNGTVSLEEIGVRWES
jgi:hypothetical protein